jgi:HprK-related kinase A
MTQIPLPTTSRRIADALRAPGLKVQSRTLRRRHYRIGPVPIGLRSDVPEVEREFNELYHPYEVAVPARDELQIDVESRWSWRWMRRYSGIFADGRSVNAAYSHLSILPQIEWAINGMIVRHLPGYLQFHASVMSLNGMGAIFAGDPGHGKSTLAAALLMRGWSYLSDEFALIDPNTKQLVAYPKALCIKAGSFDVLHRLGLPINPRKVHFKGNKGWVSQVNPLAVRENAVSDPCPLGMVVFPEYRADGEPELVPLSRAQTVFQMSHYMFNFSKYRSQGMEVLADVVRNARCFRLYSNDLNTTGELIESAMQTVQG